MSYTIGSFNMYKLNLESNENSRKNWEKIADIIKEEKFDIVAMQEVLTPNAIEACLMKKLGNDWDYVWRQPPIKSRNKALQAVEGYAFVWNKTRFKLAEESNPRIFTDWGMSGKLVRPPYVARFTPNGLRGGSFFELRLINTHIAYNKPPYDNSELSDVKYRQREMQTLAREVYNRVCDKRYGNNMPAYTILLGDYNLCLDSSPKLDEKTAINKKRSLLTVQKEKTTLKKPHNIKARDEEAEGEILADNCDDDYYSNNYDHFSYEEVLDTKLGLVSSRVEALGKYYGKNLKAYYREVSDHVPIKLVISLRNSERKYLDGLYSGTN